MLKSRKWPQNPEIRPHRKVSKKKRGFWLDWPKSHHFDPPGSPYFANIPPPRIGLGWAPYICSNKSSIALSTILWTSRSVHAKLELGVTSLGTPAYHEDLTRCSHQRPYGSSELFLYSLATKKSLFPMPVAAYASLQLVSANF